VDGGVSWPEPSLELGTLFTCILQVRIAGYVGQDGGTWVSFSVRKTRYFPSGENHKHSDFLRIFSVKIKQSFLLNLKVIYFPL
jgi:hypothetical protein